VAYNLNRKNNDLQFFEFGKTYHTNEPGKYTEEQHLSLYFTGKRNADGWKSKGERADFYFIKGVIEKIMALLGIKNTGFNAEINDKLENCVIAKFKNDVVAVTGNVNKKTLTQFDIKQTVFYADINWDKVLELNKRQQITYTEIPKYPAVYRDLAIVIDKSLPYEQVEKATFGAKVSKLQSVKLFDVFENERLGADKKSLAVSLTFLDEEKTMTDKDIDAMMGKIIASYEKELNASVRK
jgi:phenylalanyl-tRNA synthetase beta chain